MPKRKQRPTASPTTSAAAVAPISFITLKNRYPELHRAYLHLSNREKSWAQDFFDEDDERRPTGPGPLSTISGVDFTKPLSPLRDDFPLTTGSDANKFGMFVWKLLDACESGSVGGDSCRMEDVLFAALDDAVSNDRVANPLGYLSTRWAFEHLLGLALAIRSHGVGPWLDRGDAENGQLLFDTMAGAWKKLFAIPEAVLAAEGISPELRAFAIKWCKGLQALLKESRKHYGPYANSFRFNFIVTPRAKRSAADAAAQRKRVSEKKVDGRTKEWRALKAAATAAAPKSAKRVDGRTKEGRALKAARAAEEAKKAKRRKTAA